MSFTDWLDDGMSIPSRRGWRHRLSARIGYRRASRRRGVTIRKSCLISPEARINARDGAITIGEGATISPYAVIQGNVTMGSNCSVQSFAVLVGYGTAEDRVGEIRIGNDVRIAPHVMIIAANHKFDDVTRPIAKQGVERKSIVIEDDVWIAGRANIMAGVTVGRGSVVAAGAVVTHDVPPYSVVAGVPARVIKKRKQEDAE